MVPWYWVVGGVVAFGAFLYFAAKMIRDGGNGDFADWLREKWPPKE